MTVTLAEVLDTELTWIQGLPGVAVISTPDSGSVMENVSVCVVPAAPQSIRAGVTVIAVEAVVCVTVTFTYPRLVLPP